MNTNGLCDFILSDPEGLTGRLSGIANERVLELARAGKLPGHPLGDGSRRVWRFRLSELAAAVIRNVFTSQHDPVIRNAQRRSFEETSA